MLCLAFRPDGEELAVASLDGQITFWNIRGLVQTGSVEGRRDLQVGRSVEHKVTAKHLAGGRFGMTYLVYHMILVPYVFTQLFHQLVLFS